METQNNMTPENRDSNSGTNTVLLVIVIALIAFGFWWYYQRTPAAEAPKNGGINIDVTIPSGDSTTTNDSAE